MKLFFHCHKAGGTTIVAAAKNSGMKLPAAHNNGNPLGDDGKPIDWSALSDTETVRVIEEMRDAGIDFFCFEFSTPKWSVLQSIEGIQCFTVLREPLARSFSDFRMAVLNGNIQREKVFGFASFLSGNSLMRSDNFYTRFFTRTAAKARLSSDHFDEALRRLESFAAVGILELGDLHAQLGLLGFTKESFGWKNANAKKKKFHAFDPQNEGINVSKFPNDPTFFVDNAMDAALYSHFLHRSMETLANQAGKS